MNYCYLGLGSNLKSPERQIRRALKALKTLPKTSIQQVAPLYFNQAWGRKSMPDYCNTVVAIRTTLPPLSLLKRCQHLEHLQGRQRKIRYGARTLDIDILLYQNRTMHHPKLILPHPHIAERDFVLVPLSHMVHD